MCNVMHYNIYTVCVYIYSGVKGKSRGTGISYSLHGQAMLQLRDHGCIYREWNIKDEETDYRGFVA